MEPPSSRCVFCGRPIVADEPMAGRPPAAAHASCADAALADDRHWDAIAQASGEAPAGEAQAGEAQAGEGADQQPTAPGPGTARRQGCLTLLLAAALVGLAFGRYR